MDKQEAKIVLCEQLAEFRRKTYRDLVSMIEDEFATNEIDGPSGVKYQIEVQVWWDDAPGGDIRVHAAIDDGGIRAYFPLTEDFIMAADGTFVDEESV